MLSVSCPVCCSAVVTSLQEAREESGRAQAQVDQTCGQVRGLHACYLCLVLFAVVL